MAEFDGSVTLKTNIDTDGLKNGTSTIKNAAREMGNEFGKQSKQIQAALNSGNTKVAQLANNFQRATLEVEKQARKVDACLVNQGSQVFHGGLKNLFASLKLATQGDEVHELLVDGADMGIPQLLI